MLIHRTPNCGCLLRFMDGVMVCRLDEGVEFLRPFRKPSSEAAGGVWCVRGGGVELLLRRCVADFGARAVTT